MVLCMFVIIATTECKCFESDVFEYTYLWNLFSWNYFVVNFCL